MSVQLDEFLNKHGGISFPNARFRPGIPFTTGFGLDNTFESFRIHNAIDRGNAGPEDDKNPIYLPFDAEVTWHENYPGGFGSMLSMVTNFGFEIRVMHMNEVRPSTSGFLKAGTLLGFAGNKGIGTGKHTHTEVISAGETCEILDDLLKLKVGAVVVEYNKYDAEAYMKKNKVVEPEGYYAAWNRELAKRNIRTLGPFTCKRLDYHDGKLKTFYSSQAVFGF